MGVRTWEEGLEEAIGAANGEGAVGGGIGVEGSDHVLVGVFAELELSGAEAPAIPMEAAEDLRFVFLLRHFWGLRELQARKRSYTRKGIGCIVDETCGPLIGCDENWLSSVPLDTFLNDRDRLLLEIRRSFHTHPNTKDYKSFIIFKKASTFTPFITI